MKLERRTFLRAASLAGLSLVTPLALRDSGAADLPTASYDGPYFIMINCLGGWDVTRFMDPKGIETVVGGNGPVNWDYSNADIINVGTGAKPLRVKPSDYYADFFERYKSRVTFINGVDGGTNGHTQGERVTWSGTLSPGYPSVAALIAAHRTLDMDIPIPFLTFGGYDKTGDLIVPTRLQNMSAFTKVVAPGVARYVNGDPVNFHDPFAEDAIRTAATARLEAARINASLPRTGKGLDALFTARLTEDSIGRVMDYYVPAEFDALGTNRRGQLLKQGYLALSTFQAGVAVSANLAFTGWDNHSDLIGRTQTQYSDLFALLIALREGAEARGLGDKVHIFVGSDFGRTPYENATAGKDHWSVGSWMHISANPNGGRGTIGATDESMRGMNIDASLNAVDRSVAGSEKVTPSLLHNDLRRLAGVQDSDFAKAYDLEGTPPADIFA